MEKRLFLAIALSVAVMFLYKYIIEMRHPSTIPQQMQTPSAVHQDILLQHPEIKEVNTTILPERIEIIRTQNNEFTISDIGGCVKKIRMLKLKDPHSKEPVALIDIEDKEGLLYTKIFLEDQNKILNDSMYLKDITENAITYTYPETNNIEITKQINFHNINNTIELSIVLKNTSSQTKSISYELVSGTGLDGSAEPDKRFLLAQIKLPDKIQTVSIRDRRLINGPIGFQGQVIWTALKNRYFAIILKPFLETNAFGYIRSVNDKYLKTSIKVPPREIPPESYIIDKFTLYVGPQDYEAVRRLNITIEDAISYGMLGGISIFLLKLMRFFYAIVGNYGLAIVLLTIVLSVCLYPLTLKSLGSMKKLQQLQPQIDKLRQENKDNPQRLNKEIMELYRKNKINPLGGCLPMLLQMPIFFALYKALMGSVELKNARFLWIKDLSGPDAAFKLPFSLPILGNFVNILPILMLVAMFVQQKITQPAAASAQQEQKMLSVLMPVMFGFLFYNLPSGLVLYWLTNTILMLFIQWFFIRR